MFWGRLYFAVQALAGAGWWVLVFTVPLVRQATLGYLDAVPIAVLDIPLFVGLSAVAAFGATWAARVVTGWTAVVAVALAVYATVTTEAGAGVALMIVATAGSLGAAMLMVTGSLPTHWVIRGPFRFRPAAARSSRLRNLTLTAIEIVLFWTVFLAVIPAIIVFFERRWQLSVRVPNEVFSIGGVVFVLASALALWSAYVMATRGAGTPLPAAMPQRLVVAGPYLVVRNPMAVGSILQGVAVGMMLSSWAVVVYAVAGAVVWNYGVRPHEEADLEARFGDDFIAYRDAVRCWVPSRSVWSGEYRRSVR